MLAFDAVDDPASNVPRVDDVGGEDLIRVRQKEVGPRQVGRAPLVERQSIEQMMASSREHSEQDIVRLPPDEERSIVHQALTDHFRKTLDEPIPALGNQTPRKAVKTAKGRKKVIAWLKMLENQSAQQRPEEAPTTSRGCGENSALATSGGDRIEAGRSAMRKGFGVWGSAWRTRSRLLGQNLCGRFWWYGSL